MLGLLGRLLLLLPVAVASTLVAARLLGVRRSWVALTAAGVIGWVAGLVLELGLEDWDRDAVGLSVRALTFTVLFTMLAAVGLDLLARPGTLARGDRAGLLVVPHPFRDVRRLLAPYARYREIARIARRHGLTIGKGRRRSARIDPSFAVAVRRTLEEAGIVFVKLGQMASTREDLLPRELTSELALLQSGVEAAPRAAMEEQLRAELGRPVEEVFSEFDWTPIGSASVAHAYAARLVTGEAVIVKVQRPDMDALLDRDATTVRHVARTVERRTALGRDLRAEELADEFLRGLGDELDFLHEAAGVAAIAAATERTGGVRVPRVHSELVTRRVLVEERFSGGAVTDRARMEALGIEPAALADRLLRAMLDQMRYGRFHADPHPGNVMLLDDGDVGFIDFGSTGRLDATQRSALLQIITAAVRGDAPGVRDGVEQIMIVEGDVPEAALDRALSHYLATHFRPGGTIGVQAVTELVPVLAEFGIRLPSDLTMCMRALALLDGTVQGIAPGYSVKDGIGRVMGGGLPGRPGAPSLELGEQLSQELLAELPRLRRLPSQVERITALAARGELRTRVSLLSTAQDVRVVTMLVNRVLLAFIGGALILGAAVLLAVSRSEGGATSLVEVFGFVGLAVGFVLVLRVVAAVVRDGYE